MRVWKSQYWLQGTCPWRRDQEAGTGNLSEEDMQVLGDRVTEDRDAHAHAVN